MDKAYQIPTNFRRMRLDQAACGVLSVEVWFSLWLTFPFHRLQPTEHHQCLKVIAHAPKARRWRRGLGAGYSAVLRCIWVKLELIHCMVLPPSLYPLLMHVPAACSNATGALGFFCSLCKQNSMLLLTGALLIGRITHHSPCAVCVCCCSSSESFSTRLKKLIFFCFKQTLTSSGSRFM